MAPIENQVAHYEEIGSAKSSERTYTSHVNHFRFTWGANLPTNPDKLVEYLATYAASLKVSTLRQRLSAIGKWHTEHGFYDPTKNDRVVKVMRGIAKEHLTPTKQAYPLTFNHLVEIVDRLREERAYGKQVSDRLTYLRASRDLALLLIGFWQGFRSDELSRITVEGVQASSENGLELFLAYSKTDRDAKGKTYTIPKLNYFCPTDAYQEWIEASGITEGLVFRKIDRWGNLSKVGIHKQSIEHIINRVAGELFPDEPKFSTHSLRHGFADWATKNNWDITKLMNHVGWTSMDNARKYMPKEKDFGELQAGKVTSLGSDSLISPDAETLIGTYEKV